MYYGCHKKWLKFQDFSGPYLCECGTSPSYHKTNQHITNKIYYETYNLLNIKILISQINIHHKIIQIENELPGIRLKFVETQEIKV